MLYFPTWKVTLVLVICALGVIFAVPNLFSSAALQQLPDWLPKRQVNLGLDLRGGSYVLYRVDIGPVVHDQLDNVIDALRPELLDDKVGYSGGLQVIGDHISFGVRDPDRIEDVRAAVAKVAPELQMTVGKNDEVTLAFSQAALEARQADAVRRSIEIIRRRIDESGVKEPTIERQGDDRIIVELPGVGDPERLERLIGKTAKLTFQLVDTGASVEDALAGRVPPGDELLPTEEGRGGAYSLQHYVVRKAIVVGGGALTDAQATFQSNEPVVSFAFDALGARRFAEATRENVGTQLAIVLDSKVISAPVIREPILDGRGVISGNFTVQSASDLALLLRAGALPAPLTILEERTVGPGLGADSIKDGELSCLVGITLVAVFMVLFYGLFGAFADVALFFNLCLIIACLSVLGATLTLPGIAGIALTLGMAVDANVLVYERIREELHGGRTIVSALDAGFRRAFGTIFDSHLTTLVAGGLLYWFGAGPVKGFAVTLSIGVVTSLFSALLVTRLMIITWLRQTRPKVVPI
jgi:preprotein translocase subunit SecD